MCVVIPQLVTFVIADCGGTDVLLQEYGPEGRTRVHVRTIPPHVWDDQLFTVSTPSALADNGVVHLMLLAERNPTKMCAFAERLGALLCQSVLPIPISRYVLYGRGPLLCVEAC